jgi:hypothetical protein
MKYLVNGNTFTTKSEAFEYARKLAVDLDAEIVIYVRAPYIRSIKGDKSIDFSIFLEDVACNQLTDAQILKHLRALVNDSSIWSIHDHFEVHPDGSITQEEPFDDPYLFEDMLYYPDH